MNMGNLAKLAQQMQADMARVQAELETAQVEGTAGGGAVRVVATGKLDLVSVTIDPEVAEGGDTEILQDLIVAAANDALRQARELAEQKMAAVTGGMRLPPGLG
jgi:DNA-binding YbaB/EbfC family protein